MRFSEILGQEMAIRTLQRSIRGEAISHAYLFAGLEGIGKYTTALAFAAAINCEDSPESGESCGQCVQCRMIESRHHPDIQSFTPTGKGEETGIDQMREMRHMAQFPPLRGKWKVNILERAETLNDEAASCILKLVEEPPPFVIQILIATNPAAMLPTIRSRCQLVRFRAMPARDLQNALIERYGADPERAEFLASLSEGRPGRAISLLGDDDFFGRRDTIIALANRTIDEQIAAALNISEELRKLAVPKTPPPEDETEDEDAEETTQSKTKVKRSDLCRVLDVLLLWYRDLLAVKIRGNEAPVVNLDKRALVIEHAAQCKLGYLRDSLRTVTDAKRYLEGNANVHLVSDVLAMRLMS